MPQRAPFADATQVMPVLWNAMFEQAPAPMVLLAASGHVRAVNPAWQTLYNVSDATVADRVINHNVGDDPALERLALQETLAKALQGTGRQDCVAQYDPSLHGRRGSTRHVHVHCTPLGEGALYTGYVLVTLEDITQSVEADAQMQAKARQLRDVVDHAPALIFLKSLDHRFILANKAISRMFGMQFEGRYDYELFPKEEAEALHAWDRKIMQAGEAEIFEETLQIPSGPRHLLTVKFPLRDDADNIVGVGGISQDITDRVRAERENARLQVSERAAREADKVKSEFLATMSHEIRTPLAGIIGLARIVMDATQDPESRTHLKNLDAAAHMLLHILNDVLDLSKLEAKKLIFEARSFDLYSLVESSCQTLAAYASSKGLNLAWNVANALPRYVISDGSRIAQVLNNLVNNAIKFSERGTVNIDISATAAAPKSGAFWLQVSVSDQGIGIAPESLHRLFTPFSQADGSISRRFGGTGLGLTICRAIVEGMGGKIEVVTTAGEGSTFSFMVPVKAAESQVAAVERNEPTAQMQLYGKILVAEDNPVNQTIVTHQLAKLQLTPDVVTDGAAALQRVEAEFYDMVLMDCHMPNMDGFEATKRIRSLADVRRSTVPIVALTANALVGERERCLAAGMSDYLSKPVNTHDLYQCLSRYLRPSQ